MRVPRIARRSNQSICVFTGRFVAKAEIPILWPPRTDSLEKTLLLGKIKQKEKGLTEDEMVRYHHSLNGYEFEQTLGDSRGQRRLLC